MATGSSPRSVTAIDVNADGKADIIVANSGADNVGVLPNNGDGTFGAQVSYTVGTGAAPASVASSDVNADGKADIIVANSGVNNVGVLLNNGDGTFAAQTTYSTGSGSTPIFVTTADVDGDNEMDIIVANSDGDNVGVLLNNGDGTFAAQTIYSTGTDSAPVSVAVNDADADGDDDIVVANQGGNSVGLFLNQGAGTFSTQTTYSTGTGSSPSSVVLADVSGDGKNDIIVANYGSDSVNVFLAC